MSDVIGRLHGAFVFDRRIQAIARVLSDWLPAGRVLDYGAGNGALGALLMDMRPDVQIVGVDVHLRPHTQIPMAAFDGVSLPFSNATFDATICVDVLHHIDEPGSSLQ
ncbi:MAG: class I SAM-dependent methyltransferase [Anaerolineae bacterium]